MEYKETNNNRISPDDDACFSSVLSPNGRYRACEVHPGAPTYGEPKTRVIDEQTQSTLCEFENSGPSYAFSPDSRTLAIGGWEGAITVADIKTGDVITEFTHPVPEYDPDDPVATSSTEVAFSPDGKFIVSCVSGVSVLKWDLETRSAANKYATENADVNGIAFMNDCKHLLISGGGALELWNAETAELVERHEFDSDDDKTVDTDWDQDERPRVMHLDPITNRIAVSSGKFVMVFDPDLKNFQVVDAGVPTENLTINEGGLLCCSARTNVTIIDMKKLQTIATIPMPVNTHSAPAVHADADGLSFRIGNEHDLSVRHFRTPEWNARIKGVKLMFLFGVDTQQPPACTVRKFSQQKNLFDINLVQEIFKFVG